MNYSFIAIEGNIGSGKTTLALKLAAYYQTDVILEQFSDNPFLPKFYQDKERYAFPLELSFLQERYAQLKENLLHRDFDTNKVIADYTIVKSQLFARTNLDDDEYNLFLRMAEIIKTNLPKPDLLIYLHAPVARLQQQIRKRGRPFEQNIQDDYLEDIQKAYMDYLQQENLKVLSVNTTETDFNRMEHLLQLTSILEGKTVFPDSELFIR